MENLTKYTSIELLKIGNEIVVKHEQLKKEIINDTFRIVTGKQIGRAHV